MSLPVFPSASLLEKLYTEDKLSTYKIATILQCDPKTIYRYLRKYNIKTRPVNKLPISKNNLLNLYKNKHLSLKQVGILYNMTASGILKRMREFNIPMRDSWETNTGEKLPFNGSLEEKAYMIGFRLGDLGVRQSSNRTQMIKVDSNTTKREQVVLIKSLFKKYSKIWIGEPNKTGTISISTILHPSFSFLLPKNDHIENWIRHDGKIMSAFTAGYLDAEGSFGVYNKRAKFRVGSYDKGILKQINEWFKQNKIKSILELERVKKVGQNNDFWRITVNEAKSLVRLKKIILPHLRHSKRIADFTSILKNINLRAQNGTIQL